MKRLVAVLSAELVEDVVGALVEHGVHGVTIEPIASDASPTSGKRDADAPWVRLEVVVESHRADEVIESIETILETAERCGELPHLVVENVEAVVHIRSGRILT